MTHSWDIYTSLIYYRFSDRRFRNRCIKSARFIYMLPLILNGLFYKNMLLFVY